MRTIITLFLLVALGLAPALAITNQAQLQQIEQIQTKLTENRSALEARYEGFSARKKARLERKAAKLKAKIQKRSSSTSGVRLGLGMIKE